ncbi:single-stranded DNA-binding protein [Alkalibacter mobilis]|uniref:single-stranded DNA-binding protein n=1 Tax=Alkalibacter mobilis TaxID=2787712 RepID=UPI00189CB80E|nr:single-stranded DNA-binding protein [Alkalibacter mobilis]MBF7096069.1 single-stranded DNA-binding protein [Alkalibacter mobilis]
MNKVVLVGRLTRDIELRYTQKGTAVASFTIAINRRFKNQNGENETDFINCVAFGPAGENASKYVGKGSQIGISGRIQSRSYEANDGGKRYVTEVVCDEVEFLDSRSGQTRQGGNYSPAKQDQRRDDNDFGVPMDDFQPLEDEDDDLPF